MPVLTYLGQFCLPPSGMAEYERDLANKMLRLPGNTLARHAHSQLESAGCWWLGSVVALVKAARTRVALLWEGYVAALLQPDPGCCWGGARPLDHGRRDRFCRWVGAQIACEEHLADDSPGGPPGRACTTLTRRGVCFDVALWALAPLDIAP